MPHPGNVRKPKILTLTPEQVEEVFAQAQHQSDYLLGLYRLVYPDFDELASVDGFPACSEALWKVVCDKAMQFDKLHHPSVMPGGLWLNNGFTTDPALKPWQVRPCAVTYKDSAHAK